MIENEWPELNDKPKLYSCKKCRGLTFHVETTGKILCISCDAGPQNPTGGPEKYTPSGPATPAEMIGVMGKYVRETEKALGVHIGDSAVIRWLPKSQVIVHFADEVPGGDVELSVPKWLAKKHGIQESE